MLEPSQVLDFIRIAASKGVEFRISNNAEHAFYVCTVQIVKDGNVIGQAAKTDLGKAIVAAVRATNEQDFLDRGNLLKDYDNIIGNVPVVLEDAYLNPDVLGECLHTAMRKCCDSVASSIAWDAWNGICKLMPEDANIMIKSLSSQIKASDINTKRDLVDVVKSNWIDYARDYYHQTKKPKKEKVYRQFWLSLDNLSEDDWFGVVSYLIKH